MVEGCTLQRDGFMLDPTRDRVGEHVAEIQVAVRVRVEHVGPVVARLVDVLEVGTSRIADGVPHERRTCPVHGHIVQPRRVVAALPLHQRDLAADGCVDLADDVSRSLSVCPVCRSVVEVEAARVLGVARALHRHHVRVVGDVDLSVRSILEDRLVGALQCPRKGVGDLVHRRRVDGGGGVTRRTKWPDARRCVINRTLRHFLRS